MSEWFKVDEKTPKDGALVLVCYKNGYVTIYRYYDEFGYEDFHGYNLEEKERDPSGIDDPSLWAYIETPAGYKNLTCDDEM
jgi:hypothetical protein